MTTSGQLQRSLGVGDAVVIGAGSMIGAGVFAAWAPAAQAAGTGLLIGLVIAGVVAFCNATSSAQLAAVHPESGGTYVYGRRQLGLGWGHMAGWGFVVGKTASWVAMALTVGAYLWPAQQRLVAVLAVVGIVAVNIGGLTRTVAVTRVLLTVALVALSAVVVAGWTGPGVSADQLTPITGSVDGVLQAAGFLFFAFAGYARIATLGEEVRDPAFTIPRAIPRALAAVLVLYAIVAVTALAAVGPGELAGSEAPLRAVAGSDRDGFDLVIRVGAGIASLGVLLNLIPGVSRTTLAMARNGELPRWFAHVDPIRSLPLRAELTVAAVVVVLVSLLTIRSSIAVSGVAVLTYYAITNASALTLDPSRRRWPRGLAVLGLVGCVTLILSLPMTAVASGLVVLALGVAVRQGQLRLTPG
ncbi:MAG: APC family permease [Acidimicrobiia bacterium]|nr:APC family permease [Acidimicrobiia bacterium]